MTTLPSVIADERYEGLLHAIDSPRDMPARWHGTPIDMLIRSHNFGEEFESTGEPHLVLVTCMDFRIILKGPDRFAYVIRRASGTLRGKEFELSYAVSRGVKHLVLLGHNDCAMSRVEEYRETMINTLIQQGWPEARAEKFFDDNCERYSISGELDALQAECARIKSIFPKLEVAPLFVSLRENQLYVPAFHLDRYF